MPEVIVTRKIKQVQPRIEAESTPEGVVLIDKGDSWRPLIPQIVIMVGLIAVLVFLGIRTEGAQRKGGFAILAGVLGLVVLILGIVSVRQLLKVLKMAPGELLLPHWPLRLGDRVTVRYRRELKGALDIQSIAAKLVCKEVASYRHGTETQTAMETVFEQKFDPVEIAPGTTTVTGTWDLAIPHDLSPSLKVPDNEVQWSFSVHLKIHKFPDDSSDFALLVAPEVSP